MAIQLLRGTTAQIASNSSKSVAGQPLYDTDKHILYIGDGVTTVKELKGTVIGLSGEGLDSIVQPYSGDVDETHFGNRSTGESAAVFGEANISTANRTLVGGKLNVVDGANAFAVGIWNTIESTAISSVIGGNNNTVKGQSAIATGTENEANGYASAVFGRKNKATVGQSFAAGYENEVNAADAAVFGAGNINNARDSLVCGKNNLHVDGILFAVGNGSSKDARSNAFTVSAFDVKSNIRPNYGYEVLRLGDIDSYYDDQGRSTSAGPGNQSSGSKYALLNATFNTIKSSSIKVTIAPSSDNDVLRWQEKTELDNKIDGIRKSLNELDSSDVSFGDFNVLTMLTLLNLPYVYEAKEEEEDSYNTFNLMSWSDVSYIVASDLVVEYYASGEYKTTVLDGIAKVSSSMGGYLVTCMNGKKIYADVTAPDGQSGKPTATYGRCKIYLRKTIS